jgi:hypothetical protein
MRELRVRDRRQELSEGCDESLDMASAIDTEPYDLPGGQEKRIPTSGISLRSDGSRRHLYLIVTFPARIHVTLPLMLQSSTPEDTEHSSSRTPC